jgi:hypothetical protein
LLVLAMVNEALFISVEIIKTKSDSTVIAAKISISVNPRLQRTAPRDRLSG